ncbi:MAG: hypothetical protein JSS86_07255 [Cyanobacteria bacterium SZAS LIN-2]|nr:hypothetical protein [Cyanobacteria bacterium SZAS LIN-3]MBS1996089.1 hypothetical protein [Cyanobacteria bacterium SZAS LIN-2]
MTAPASFSLPARIAAAGLALGIFCSVPLWTGWDRTFPLCPLLPLPHSWILDQILTAAAIVCSLSITANRRLALCAAILCGAMLTLIAFDLNRFQPWVYEYAIIIALGLLTKGTDAETNARPVALLLTAIYLFSGMQKFNWRFLAFVGPWLLGVTPTPSTGCEDSLPVLAGSLILALTEVSLALALCFARSRKIGVALALAMHVAILYILGPQHFNINAAVWPWNITQMTLLIVYAIALKGRPLLDFAYTAKRLPLQLLLVSTCLIVPSLGLLQLADPYPAFAFYTGDIPSGKLFFARSLVNKLSRSLQKMCYFDNKLHLWALDMIDWSNLELGASSYANTYCIYITGQGFAAQHPEETIVLELDTYPKPGRKKKEKFVQLTH